MKAFIALCFLAVAAAEADPALIYRTAGLYGVSPYHTSAVGYSAINPLYSRSIYGSPLGYRLIKREAEAEAEADPALVYGYNSGLYGGVSPIAYSGLSTVSTISPFYNRAIYGSPLGYRLIKREAEAEAEADPALFYSAGLPYATNFYSAWNQPLNYAALPAYPGGYAAAGKYVANSAGVVHVAKREAEAEADPALLVSSPYTTGFTGYTTGFTGLPVRSAVAYPSVYSTLAGRYWY